MFQLNVRSIRFPVVIFRLKNVKSCNVQNSSGQFLLLKIMVVFYNFKVKSTKIGQIKTRKDAETQSKRKDFIINTE